VRRVLFVCGKNRRRSPTAEAIFSGQPNLEVSSAGTAADADCPVSGDLIEWADTILVMESHHTRQLRQQFGPLLRDKRIISLDIPDRYDLMQPELVELLQARVPPRLR
jgi:predicted protein tyrosine phosphatase